MKGIVFTEFLELVEEKFGLEVVDRILQASALPSGGAYTMQVVRNLLGNAVKFSPPGGTIEVGIHRGERSVVVFVRDQGVGIPEVMMPGIDGYETCRRLRTHPPSVYVSGTACCSNTC